jgi:hypothetical protein
LKEALEHAPITRAGRHRFRQLLWKKHLSDPEIRIAN